MSDYPNNSEEAIELLTDVINQIQSHKKHQKKIKDSKLLDFDSLDITKPLINYLQRDKNSIH